MRPVIEERRRMDGKASRIYSETGAKRYITPVEQVPIAVVPSGCSEKGGWVV
jgi:hypothetical protein